MTRRQDQLNSRILEILTPVFQSELEDPRLQSLNLTRVQVNKDASHAALYFTASDDEYTPKEREAGLMRAKGYLRSILAEILDLRYTPDLTFRYDTAAEETQRIYDLFDEIAEERRRNPPKLDITEEEEAK
jgi:ribosome-binding factor A